MQNFQTRVLREGLGSVKRLDGTMVDSGIRIFIDTASIRLTPKAPTEQLEFVVEHQPSGLGWLPDGTCSACP